MKMKSVVICVFFSLVVTACLWGADLDPRSKPVPDLFNLMLVVSDLPAGSVKTWSSTVRTVDDDFWWYSLKNDYFPGMREVFRNGDMAFAVKYGVFSTPEEARDAVLAEVMKNPSGLQTGSYKEGSFSGSTFGDKTLRWETSYEARPGVEIHEEDSAKLGFSLGRNAAFVDMGWIGSTWGTKDKTFVDFLARKCEHKIRVSQSLTGLTQLLPSSISNAGVLHSLQVKLDNFLENYRQGDYKGSLNNLNSFINEVDAQRGKKVSEPAYQTLKAQTDIIVNSLMALLTK
jgi:hypothetical protein